LHQYNKELINIIKKSTWKSMSDNKTSEKMSEMLKKEQEELMNEINNKIKKRKSFSNPDTGNQFLK